MTNYVIYFQFLATSLLFLHVYHSVAGTVKPAPVSSETFVKCGGPNENSVCKEYEYKVRKIVNELDQQKLQNFEMKSLTADREFEEVQNSGTKFWKCMDLGKNKCPLEIYDKFITICYPSVHQQINDTKSTKRFHLNSTNGNKKLCDHCKECKTENSSTILYGVQITNKEPDLTIIEATVFEGQLILRENVDADFLIELFGGNEHDKKCGNNGIFGNDTMSGMFLSDVEWKLKKEKLQMDLASTLSHLNTFKSKSKRNIAANETFWFSTNEASYNHMDHAVIKARLKKCNDKIDKWNKEAGRIKYKIDVDYCLMSEEDKDNLYGAQLTEWDEEKPDVYWTENYSGPKEPPPLNSSEPEPKWTSSEKVDPEDLREYLPEEWFRPKHFKRSIRQIGTKTEFTDVECTRNELDIRKANEQCGEITGHIWKQGFCGNCWAIATASALTDRTCFVVSKHRLGKVTLNDNLPRIVSARDLMECSHGTARKCDAHGSPSMAWEYIVNKGTINEKCKPYPIKDGAFDKSAIKRCNARCDYYSGENGSLDLIKWGISSFDKLRWTESMSENHWEILKSLAGTLYRAESSIAIQNKVGPEWERMLMDEIETNGSIVAIFDVHDDFHEHITPFYRHAESAVRTGRRHAVRLIGFGQLECTGGPITGGGSFVPIKYWIVANSWGPKWKEDGTFRIARGEDESGIESIQISWGNMIFPYLPSDKSGKPTKIDE